MRISTNGAEAMRIDSSGNVGIGEASPLGNLHVKNGDSGASSVGSAADELVLENSTDSGMTFLSGTSGFASINFADSGDANVGQILYSHGSNYLAIKTNDSERMRITSSGRMGLGITSPQQRQHIHENSTAASVTQYTNSVTGSAASDGLLVGLDSTEDGLFWMKESNNLTFGTSNTEQVRIDSSGRLLVNHTADTAPNSYLSKIQLCDTSYQGSSLSIRRDGATSSGPVLLFAKSRSTSKGGNTVVQNGDSIGSLYFYAADGTDADTLAGEIAVKVDGTPGGNNIPTRMVFSTNTGASDRTERMRIDNEGIIYHVSENHAHGNYVTASAGTNKFLFRGHHSASAGSYTSGTIAFTVWSNGNVQNINNSYGAISDVKLKENIAGASSQWDDIKAIQVRKYNFKASTGQPTHTQLGVVAQEVEAVSPGLVYETTDTDGQGNDLGTVTKSVNYSVLYMKAIKALQEAQTRIESLEARLDAGGL